MGIKRFQVDPRKLEAKIENQRRRILERFADREIALVEHCQSLQDLLTQAKSVRGSLLRPNYLFRFVVVLLLAGLATGGYFLVSRVTIDFSAKSITELLQGLDSAKNLLVAIAVVIGSLFFIEVRIKRARAVRFLDQLTALALVIGLAQQAKDPDRLMYSPKSSVTEGKTESSPDLGGTTTAFLMSRYLDYCQELLTQLLLVASFLTEGSSDQVVISRRNQLSVDVAQIAAGIGRKETLLGPMINHSLLASDAKQVG